MAGYNSNSLLDVFNSASQFGGGVADYLNEQLQKRDDQKLKALQLEYIKRSNDFLNSLQTEGNFDKWPTMFDDFISQMDKLTKDETIDRKDDQGNIYTEENPYHVDSNYLSKKSTEWLNQQYLDLQNKVTVMTMGKVQQQTKNISDSNIETAFNQMKGTAFLDFMVKSEKEQYENGNIDNDQHKAELQSWQTKAIEKYMEDTKTDMLNDFDSSYSPSEAANRLEQEMQKHKNDYNVKDDINGVEYTADERDWDSRVKNAKADMKQKWAAEIETYQENNQNLLAAAYRKVEAAQTPDEKLEAKKSGMRLLEQIGEKKNSLKPTVSDHYAALFGYDSKELTGGSGSGSGSSSSGATGLTLTEILKEDRKTWMQKFANGDLGSLVGIKDAYKAKEMYTDQLYQDCSRWRDSKDHPLTQQQYDEYINGQESNIDTFVIDAVEALPYGNQAWIKEQVTDWAKEMKRNPDQYQIDYVVGRFQDLLSESNQQDWDKNKARDEIRNMMGTVTAMKLDALSLDRNGNLNAKLNTEDRLGKALLQLENNDVLYQDYQGKDQSMPIKTKKGVVYAQALLEQPGGLVDQGKGQIAAMLSENGFGNVAASRIDFHWERTKNGHDINTVPVFTFTIGGYTQTFTIEAVDDTGKTTKDYDKVAGIQIKGLNINKDGEVEGEQVIKNTTAEKIQLKEEKQAAKAASKNAQKNKNAQYKDLDWRQVDLLLGGRMDENDFVNYKENGSIGDFLSKVNWESRQKSRLDEVKKLVGNDGLTWENKGVDLKGVSKEQWDTWIKNKDYNQILKALEIAHYSFKDLNTNR